LVQKVGASVDNEVDNEADGVTTTKKPEKIRAFVDPTDALEWERIGMSLYASFDISYYLTTSERITDGPVAERKPFEEMLHRLHHGVLIYSDYTMLKAREYRLLTIDERQAFDGAPHIFATNAAADMCNLTCLERMVVNGASSLPVTPSGGIVRIAALHETNETCRQYVHVVPSTDAFGLRDILHLAEGVPCVLTTNISVKAGLVNGSVGTVRHVIYEDPANLTFDGKGNPTIQPLVAIVHFSSYRGPQFPFFAAEGSQYHNCIPLMPIKRRVQSKIRRRAGQKPLKLDFQRVQLPLSLGFGRTIHKCQGMSMGKVVVDIGPTEFAPGLTYVAVSRSRSLGGLCLADDTVSIRRLEALDSKPTREVVFEEAGQKLRCDSENQSYRDEYDLARKAVAKNFKRYPMRDSLPAREQSVRAAAIASTAHLATALKVGMGRKQSSTSTATTIGKSAGVGSSMRSLVRQSTVGAPNIARAVYEDQGFASTAVEGALNPFDVRCLW